jgi:hypothetical protein
LIFISDLVIILLIAMYLVLNPLLNYIFFPISSINIWFLYQIRSLFFFLVIFSFSYPFINWNYFFNFIPYNLILFSFYVKFGSYSFQIYIFFDFILCFKFILNYFGWLIILRCYFFGFPIHAVIWPRDPCHKFWKLDEVGFNHF